MKNKIFILVISAISLTFIGTTTYAQSSMGSFENAQKKTVQDLYVSTLAGSGTAGFADGSGTAAGFNKPGGIAVDSSGNVYVADSNNHRIRKIDRTGEVSTLAGSGTKGFADGHGTAAKFNRPMGVAVDRAGNVYVADTSNHRIRKIESTGRVSTLAGTEYGYADGSGTSAKFNSPWDIAVDSSGNLYVADAYNHMIRKIDHTGEVSTLAGDGTKGFADGPGISAKFDYPYGITVDRAGNIYVADSGNHRIRKIDSTGQVSTLAGDETGNVFYSPLSVTVDNTGNVYARDLSRIRKIDNTGQVSVLFDSEYGYADGFEISAKYTFFHSIVIDATGNFYFSDTDNNRIRRITYGEPEPAVKLGELIGTIGAFDGADVIVNGTTDAIGRQAPIGSVLIVEADGQYIYLQSIFPMQTIVKCRVTSGDRSQIKRGMKVYLKP